MAKTVRQLHNDAARTMLLIEAPAHPDNERAILLPVPFMAADPLPAGMSTGRVLVRVDIADDRTLQDLTVIQDTVGGVSPALFEAIRERFSLIFESEKQHRVVTYAVLDVGETVTVLDSASCCRNVVLAIRRPSRGGRHILGAEERRSFRGLPGRNLPRD